MVYITLEERLKENINDLDVYNTETLEPYVKNGRFIVKLPEIIHNDFICRDLGLTSLEGGPKIIKGSFDCSGNELNSLYGGPKKVYGSYYCFSNNLISLIYSPEK